MTPDNGANQQDKWPGVEHAFAFVLPSYQLLVGRFEAADNRLTALLTFTATVTLGAPIFAKNVNPAIAFDSPWFVAGLAFFLCGAIAGIFGRIVGGVVLPDPAVLYRQHLHNSEWTFKKDQIYWAGQHFSANARTIENKGTATVILTASLLFEVAMLVIWLTR